MVFQATTPASLIRTKATSVTDCLANPECGPAVGLEAQLFIRPHITGLRVQQVGVEPRRLVLISFVL